MPITDIEDYSKLEVNVQFIFSKIAQLFTETTLQFIIFIYVPIIVIIIIITIIAFTAFTSSLSRVFNWISFELLD